MSIYNHSTDNLMKQQCISSNNISSSESESFSLKNFYDGKFSSSAIMATFANNFHHMHHQSHYLNQHHHHSYQLPLTKSNQGATSYSSSYPYTQSYQYNPYFYQPLTPPHNHEDFYSKTDKNEESLRKDSFSSTSNESHNHSFGK